MTTTITLFGTLGLLAFLFLAWLKPRVLRWLVAREEAAYRADMDRLSRETQAAYWAALDRIHQASLSSPAVKGFHKAPTRAEEVALTNASPRRI